jgi:hypothetical protein
MTTVCIEHTHFGLGSYTEQVEQLPVVEDQRGVDIGQIRRQLRLSVPERVRTMVEAANVMIAIQTAAQASLRHPSG